MCGEGGRGEGWRELITIFGLVNYPLPRVDNSMEGCATVHLHRISGEKKN